MGEMSEFIRARVQTARDIQRRRFGIRSLETSDSVIGKADMRVGEIRQFCKLPDEGQSLMHVKRETGPHDRGFRV